MSTCHTTVNVLKRYLVASCHQHVSQACFAMSKSAYKSFESLRVDLWVEYIKTRQNLQILSCWVYCSAMEEFVTCIFWLYQWMEFELGFRLRVNSRLRWLRRQGAKLENTALRRKGKPAHRTLLYVPTPHPRFVMVWFFSCSVKFRLRLVHLWGFIDVPMCLRLRLAFT